MGKIPILTNIFQMGWNHQVVFNDTICFSQKKVRVSVKLKRPDKISNSSHPKHETMIFWLVVSNSFYFHPYLGKIPNLTNIFQMGWNHQVVLQSVTSDKSTFNESKW